MGEIHKIQKNGVTIYPATTTDAVVDSHFKKSIIGLFNYITLDFDTSAYDTRLKIPMEYRRYGLIVGYFNSLTGKYIIEQYLNNSVFSDGTWGKDDSWINILNADDIYASAMHIRQDSFSTLQNSNNLFKFDFPKGKKLYVKLNWDNGSFVSLLTSGKEGNLSPLIEITEKNKFIEIIPSKPINSIGYITNSANCNVKIELYSEVTVQIAKNSDAILQKADKVDLESVRTISDMNNEIISNGYLLSNGYNNTTPAANSYGFIPFKQEKISGIKAVYLQDNAENLSDLYVVALKYNSEANFSGVRKSLLVWNPDKNRYDTDLDLEEGEYYGFMTNSATSIIKSLECYEGDTDDFSIQSASMANTILSLNTPITVGYLRSKCAKYKIIPKTDIFTQEEGKDLQEIVNNKADRPQYYGVKDTKALSNNLISTDTCSVELWCKMYKPSANTALFGSSLDLMRVYVNTDNNIRGAGYDGSSNYISLKTDYFFQEGDVVHIVMVYDYSINKVILYINGELAGETEVSGNNKKISHIFTCNNSYIGYARAYNKALTLEEIKVLYNYNQPTDINIPSNLKDFLLYDYSQVSILDNKWYDNNGNVSLNMYFTSPVFLETQLFSNAKDILFLKEATANFIGLVPNTYRIDFRTVVFSERGNHDCTFVDEKIWSFNQPSEGGAIFSINPDGSDGTKICTTNFIDSNGLPLEMKSVDYKNGILAVGNGSSTTGGDSHESYKHVVYLFYQPQNWEATGNQGTIPITFDNCGEYLELDFSKLGYKMYGFWGPSNDTMYLSCNLFNDIFLVQLGKGSNNLGDGNYKESGTNRYNGSYKIIEHWHQDNGLGDLSAHGGQFYKDSLYLASNDATKCTIYKLILDKDGSIRFNELNFEAYPDNGQEVNYGGKKYYLKYSYIDGMCINNNTIYAQPLNVNGIQTGRFVIVANI